MWYSSRKPSEWVIGVYHQMRNVLYLYIDIKVSFWWGDDDALFQIDQHALLEFCACSKTVSTVLMQTWCSTT